MLSPSLLKLTLVQPSIDPRLYLSLAAEFRLGGPGWRFLDRLNLPANLPATGDPLLLALRRLAAPDPGDLRAMHRIAAEKAAERPHGLAFLALEEIALEAESGRLPEDQLLLVFTSFYLAFDPDENFHREASDLEARAVIELVRYRLAPRRGKKAARFLELARSHAARGTGELELDIYLNETRALEWALAGKWDSARELWIAQIERLLDYPVPDRAAESLADLTDLLVHHRREVLLPEPRLYESAAARLAELPPKLNRKLRRRFGYPQIFGTES